MSDVGNVAAFDVLAPQLWQPFLEILKMPRHDRDAPKDERHIREVIYDYCHHYDAGNVDGMMKLFTRDAILVNALGRYEGYEDIRKNYAESIERRIFGFHYVTNICIRFSQTDDEAISTCYLFTVNMLPENLVTFVSGTYVDRLVRLDGNWMIAEKRVTADIRFTAPGDTSVALAPKGANIRS